MHLLCVVDDLAGLRISHKGENIALLRIDVAMFALVPFALIQHFRKNQRRLDRLENMRLVKRVVDRVGAGADDIRDKLVAASLGEHPRRQLIARAEHRSDFDFGVLLFKSFDHTVVFVATAVERQLRLEFRRAQSFFPFLLPIRLRRYEHRQRNQHPRQPGDAQRSIQRRATIAIRSDHGIQSTRRAWGLSIRFDVNELPHS